MSLKTCALMIGALFTMPVMAANVLYTAQPCEIEAKAGSDYLGTLTVATPVTVLKKSGDFTQVRIDGGHFKNSRLNSLRLPMFVSNTRAWTKKMPSKLTTKPSMKSLATHG